MAASSNPPQRNSEHRIPGAGPAREALRAQLEDELRRHPTRPKHRARRVRGRALAVIMPALVAGGAVLLLARDSGEQGAVAGPPIPSGIEKRAAEATRSPDVILTPPAKAGPRGHPIGPIRPPRPVAVAIPGVGLAARVGSVGASGGHIDLPPVSRAGWFKGGPRPGEPGRTVIIGHLDGPSGPAVFADLPKARRGEQVLVTDAGGRVRRYRVASAISVPKKYFSAPRVFASTPASTLALITCGGPFDRKSGHYELNVLVYAQLAGQRPRQDSNLRPTA
jgi:Sortase domain